MHTASDRGRTRSTDDSTCKIKVTSITFAHSSESAPASRKSPSRPHCLTISSVHILLEIAIIQSSTFRFIRGRITINLADARGSILDAVPVGTIGNIPRSVTQFRSTFYRYSADFSFSRYVKSSVLLARMSRRLKSCMVDRCGRVSSSYGRA